MWSLCMLSVFWMVDCGCLSQDLIVHVLIIYVLFVKVGGVWLLPVDVCFNVAKLVFVHMCTLLLVLHPLSLPLNVRCFLLLCVSLCFR